MFGHKHLPKLIRQLNRRITFTSEYIGKNGPIDTRVKYKEAKIPDFVAELELLKEFLEINNKMLISLMEPLLTLTSSSAVEKSTMSLFISHIHSGLITDLREAVHFCRKSIKGLTFDGRRVDIGRGSLTNSQYLLNNLTRIEGILDKENVAAYRFMEQISELEKKMISLLDHIKRLDAVLKKIK
jgi:hypothetical protein